MSKRFATKARRGMVAVAVVAGLTFGAAACSSDDDKKDPPSSSASKSDSGPGTQTDDPGEKLAELKGQEGLLLSINSAKRDSGGFVTVNGSMKNDGGKSVNVPAQLSGDETEILRHGVSLGGATLVDSKGKKRYYVLRDTEGRPLTTTGFPAVKAGESVPVFMQFPAPPASTSEVTFQIPTFSSASIKISG
ncbi:hypothetical protein [Streptomyces sp. NPDC058045]|uniref:hypothetical protein n=1 Tax=Streptomyces sp. NPDC058045 TaxID=3346311 RepID=UPI0036EFC58C